MKGAMKKAAIGWGKGSNEGGKGRWKPVLYGKRRSAQRSVNGAEVFSLFVDNIPMSMAPKDQYFLFMKFGVVKDVFIPNKMRKATRSRFGFVRYNCSVAAKVAIQKANGLV
ncbi:hypothetical protein ACSBR2_017798 [Camellia fascicularis]